ncbi:MAG: acetolactate synthase small subunit [Firmicutes bacterium HGW-Firmicutes-11]|jgi:acetolactate synthase-1/3 small subunit|nr:MAG: acetolactate synthase small subunit [Firmicutes bacterium HGW-Firmicutes-11]
MKKYTLSIVVENNPGVLARVASLFGRRGYNIDSLTVSETNDPGTSHITLTVTGDEQILEQIIKQVYKLEEVIKVVHLSDSNTLSRELLLIKMDNGAGARTQLREIVDIYEAKIVDLAPGSMIIELTGAPQKIDAFLGMMKEFRIIEMCRTGVTAMEKDSSKS